MNATKIAAAASGGLLMTAAFPSPGVDILAWIAIIPLLFALDDLPGGDAFRMGIVFGLFHYATLLYWVIGTMHIYGNLPYYLCLPVLLLLSCYLSLYTGFFTWFAAWLPVKPMVRLALLPFVWTALEQARSILLTGFPWGLLGHSQYNRLPIIQIAEVTGVAGISFLIIAGNVALFWLLLYVTRRRWFGALVSFRSAAFCILLFAVMASALIFYGRIRLDQIETEMKSAPQLSVRVVQGNISQAVKWNPLFQVSSTRKYADLSLRGAPDVPDLVVWPETATPFYLGRNPHLTALVTGTAQKLQTSLLVGSPAYERSGDEERYFNSAYIISSGGKITGRYDKVHLVPFGEYVPLGSILSFVGKMVEAVGDFSVGQEGKNLHFGRGKVGVQICFEIIFPGLSRALTANGADFLTNITNDAWFGRTSAPHQHFSIAVFRAVENRRALVRCANTGISGFILPTGKVAAVSQLFVDAVMTNRIPVIKTETIYTRYGDWLAVACLLVTAVAVIFGTIRNKSGRKNKP